MLQISQRPLQATLVDGSLFVDRASELEKLDRAVRHGFNVMVLGDRGSGKTSLLRQFERHLIEGEIVGYFVEASAAGTVAELVDLVYAETHGRRRDSTERLLASLDDRDDITEQLRLLTPPDGEQGVVILDSIRSPELVQHLFGRLRDDVWRQPITWIVSGQTAERGRYLEPPADSFFDAVIEVGDLDEEAAAELGRAPAMLFTEVMDLGPVSASDAKLLGRLSWTRPRAAQVFKQLEQAGLVVATEEAPDGPGRPRKLYAGNSMYHALDSLKHGDEQ